MLKLIFLNNDEVHEDLQHIISENVIQSQNNFNMNQNQKEIFNLMLDNWIRSAIDAKMNLRKGDNYEIINQEIIIVDKENTGEMKKNMRWGNGIHQYLEMKHNIKQKSDGFTSIFQSNAKFFCMYKQNIYGLTGTLGS